MDRFQRFFSLHKLLNTHRYPVPRRKIEATLECSESTVKRTVEHMRDFLGAPIEYDREANGYYYDTGQQAAFELPGLWFSAGELAALAALEQLLEDIEPGLLREELAPARRRVDQLLENEDLGLAHLRNRVRILGQAARRPGSAFHACAEALVRERRLAFDYYARTRNEITRRRVSPQRFTHYRDNWYLDAWCHEKQALRTFSIDRIRKPSLDKAAATQLPDEQLDRELADAYGIFSGPATKTAVLEFTPHRARWVADERWHPEQHGEFTPEGRYRLEIPYGDDRELIGDILRHGPEVEVIAPRTLRERVRDTLVRAAEVYNK